MLHRLAVAVAAVLVLSAAVVDAKGPPRKRIAVTATPISAVQGDGLVSAAAGSTVTVVGVVTARTADGFFVQSGDGETDGNPATSEGLFVHLGAAPDALATVGHRVELTGPIEEYLPPGRPHQMPLTRMGAPETHTVLATGQALPAPIALSSADLHPDMDVAALERFEGMRVSLPTLVVVGPTGAVLDETLRTATSTGVLHATLYTGNFSTGRPFREPGLPVFDANPVPPGKTPPLFDGNPETLRIDSTGQPGASRLDLGSPDRIDGAVGVLTYAEAAYTLLPDPSSPLVVTNGYRGEGSGGSAPDQFRMVWLDLGRLYDDADEPTRAEPVPSTALYQARLVRLAKILCTFLANPDIVAVTGAENVQVLQDLSDVVDSNPSTYCPTPADYLPLLVEGQSADGLDVGLLVSARTIDGLNPRVEVLASAPLFAAATSAHPAGGSEPLFPSPPLMARLRVTNVQGGQADVSVLANRLQPLDGIDDMAAGSDGWTTAGERVMTLRARQAQTLAGWIEDFQQADPDAALAVLGGFEAHPFNDGRVDTLGVIMGRAAPPAETLLAVASPVTTPLTNALSRTPAVWRFKGIRDGHAEALDHILVNDALLRQFALEWRTSRMNSEFPASLAANNASNFRTSERDPVVIALAPAAFSDADTSVRFIASSPATSLQETRVYFDVGNDGPDLARGLELVMRSSLTPTAYAVSTEWPGWTCDPPEADGSGSLTVCRQTGLVATDTHGIVLTIPANPALARTTQTFEAVLKGAHRDADTGNNSTSGSVFFEDRTDLRVNVASPGTEDLMPGQTGRFIVSLDTPRLNPAGDISVELTIDGAASEVTLDPSHDQISCGAGVDIAPRRSRWTCLVAEGAYWQYTSISADFSTRLDDGSRIVGLTAKATPTRTELTPADNEASATREVSDKTDLSVSGYDQEQADLEDPLYLHFHVRSPRIGVTRNASAEILIGAPLSSVGPVAVVPDHTSVTWTCAAPEAVTADQTRLRCQAPAVLEQPDHVIRAWSFNVTVTPPFRPGLESYTLPASMSLTMDSQDVNPADNQATSNATIDQTTDLRTRAWVESAQVVEPDVALYRVNVQRLGRNQPRNPTLRLELDAELPHQGLAVTNYLDQAVACAPDAAAPGRTALLCPLGQEVQLHIALTTGPDLAGRTLVLDATAEDELIDAAPSDDASTTSLSVVAQANLCVDGTCPFSFAEEAKLVSGGPNEVVHVLRNLGPSTARDTTLTIDAALAPARLSASLSQGNCAAAVAIGGGTSRIVCQLGDRIGQAGQAITLQLGLDTSDLAGGPLPYSLTLSSPTTDLEPDNNRFERTLTVHPDVDLSVAMRARGRAYPGTQHFLLDLRADGPANSALSSLVLKIDAPGGVGYGRIRAPGWICENDTLFIPGHYEYYCQRIVSMTPGQSHPVELVVDAQNFTQIGTVIRVTAEHFFPGSQPAGDRNASNNSASALQGVGGRRTQTLPLKPTPAYGADRPAPTHAPVRNRPERARTR